ncbi:MAG: transcription elongation factor GreA [Myxococcales bacterium]|mgnify:CR=1 FL=1|nr:transcription elongation factor GreA [Myxococcales bacterium]
MHREPFTPEGLLKAKARLKQLREVERPNVVKAIEEARAHGDLSENAEYHAAKDLQGFIEAEIRQLEGITGRSQLIDPKKLSGDRVVFGATVTVFDPDRDEEHTYKIVNTCVSDTDLGHISYQAPIARALIGKEIGDEVIVKLPGGERTLEILEVEFV